MTNVATMRALVCVRVSLHILAAAGSQGATGKGVVRAGGGGARVAHNNSWGGCLVNLWGGDTATPFLTAAAAAAHFARCPSTPALNLHLLLFLQVCGPYVLGILTQESVADLNIIEGACLGIIGLAAGAELQLGELYRSKKQVGRGGGHMCVWLARGGGSRGDGRGLCVNSWIDSRYSGNMCVWWWGERVLCAQVVCECAESSCSVRAPAGRTERQRPMAAGGHLLTGCRRLGATPPWAAQHVLTLVSEHLPLVPPLMGRLLAIACLPVPSFLSACLPARPTA